MLNARKLKMKRERVEEVRGGSDADFSGKGKRKEAETPPADNDRFRMK